MNPVRHAASMEVAPGVLLDARLALVHPKDRWLAIADVHYAHELSQRAAGGLGPLWGMDNIRTRLAALVSDYRPQRLILCGDTVHNRAGRAAAMEFLSWLEVMCERIILVAGNHDRRVFPAERTVESYEIGAFMFTHGDLPCETPSAALRIEGHWHPAVRLADGAGLNLRLPAFIMEPRRWILPAFSPWAGGTIWHGCLKGTRTFAVAPGRILEIP